MLKRVLTSLVCFCCLTAIAQNRSHKYTVDFVKVWGFLKYYHPSLGSGKINPDDLFLTWIDRVGNAGSDKEYAAVLEEIYQSVGGVTAAKIGKEGSKLFTRNDKTVWVEQDKLLSPLVRKSFARWRKQGYTDSVHQYMPSHFYATEIPAERLYDSIIYPNVKFQLLALARYWNAIEYLFAYKYMAPDWDKMLIRQVPFFSKPMSAADFELHLLQLNSGIEDTHGGIVRIKQSSQVYGQFFPPFTFQFVDEKNIVVMDFVDSVSCAKQDIRKGDIITGIGNRRVDQAVADRKHLVSASNAPQLRHLLASIPLMLPLRSKDSIIQITTLRKGVSLLSLHQLTETVFASNLQKLYEKQRGNGTTTQNRFVLRSINKDVAQVDAANLSILYNNSADDREVDSVLALMRTHQKAIILDLRCYATQAVFYNKFIAAMGGRLQKFSTLLAHSKRYPGKYYEEDILSPVKPGTPQFEKYTSPLILLVNEQTKSQSELITMIMQATGLNTIVVGTQTAGCDGDLIYYPVPGGYTLTFSGRHVEYPDGTVTQKAGIRIDKRVTITAAALAGGRDEILEAALKLVD
ncbi:S41 family peptidase [Terrimonas sp. NA20]|uniref:S41 family peptidase n=1 Tax=Terrimonas ginsenosidimutans TaxID=2908004 RepID=A0ABS9KX45_9BACT|nr:S41 family peptidase [Terrimonas ginsenosidimutans]MCG2616883.1 S41 family peptidase [Terrimonas ginsenosidimutans]